MVYRQREVLVNFSPSFLSILCFVGMALVYGFANILLAFAWQKLMIWSGEQAPGWPAVRYVYARSALAKYIPGNVAQFVGRQVLGRAEGWSHHALGLSALMEITLLVLVALLMAVIAFVFFDLDLPLQFSLSIALLSTAAMVCGIALLPMVLNRLKPGLFLKSFLSVSDWLKLFKVLPFYFTFFICGGFALHVVAAQIMPINVVQIVPGALLLFSVAWIAGILTPGAPSGIGVREAVIVAALTPFASPAECLLIAILLRIVTILGDLVFFVVFGIRWRISVSQKRNSSIG